MKKNILAMVLIVSMILATAIPRRSEAGLGALLAAPAVITIGAVTGGVAAAAAIGGLIAFNGKNEVGVIVGFVVMFYGAIGSVLGLVILDDHSSNLELEALRDEHAAALGISTTETQAYNQELDEINAAKKTIEAEVRAMEKPSIDHAQKRWQEMRGNISPDAFSALEKISAEFVRNLRVNN